VTGQRRGRCCSAFARSSPSRSSASIARTWSAPTTLGLTGEESFTIRGLDRLAPKAVLDVEANAASGAVTRFKVIARVDDPIDLDYMKNGGVLPLVFRELLAKN